MRLNRFLAVCGVASRRAAEQLITAGRVTVNGEVVSELATFVEPGRDRVDVDGRVVTPATEIVYLLLHKPVGFITTMRDPQRRPTVVSLVPPLPRVFPVGRLDQDTSGALLLTNDGNLTHRLLHPRFKVEKEYLVLAEGAMTEDELERLRRGILLEGNARPTAPAEVEVVERWTGRTRLRMVIREGRKRQVRNMLATVGHPVSELARVRFGPVELGDLESGTHRPLTAEELAGLRETLRTGGRSRGARKSGKGRAARAARQEDKHE